jgi:hypothetical protein
VGRYPPQPSLHLTPPYPIALLPNGSGYCSSQTSSHIHPNITNPVHSTHTRSPVKMEQTECSETSAFKTQPPGNYPKEIIQHSKHGESLKSRSKYLECYCYICSTEFWDVGQSLQGLNCEEQDPHFKIKWLASQLLILQVPVSCLSYSHGFCVLSQSLCGDTESCMWDGNRKWILTMLDFWDVMCRWVSGFWHFKLDLVKCLYANILWLYTAVSVIHELCLTEESGVWLTAGQETVSSSNYVKHAGGPPASCLIGTMLRGWWLEAHHVHIIPKLRICGALPLLPPMPSWRGALLSTQTTLPFPLHAHFAICYSYL